MTDQALFIVILTFLATYVVGIVGAALYVRSRKKKRRKRH